MKTTHVLSLFLMLSIAPLHCMDVDGDAGKKGEKEAPPAQAINPTESLFKACRGKPNPAVVAFLLQNGALANDIRDNTTPLLIIVDQEEADVDSQDEAVQEAIEKRKAIILRLTK